MASPLDRLNFRIDNPTSNKRKKSKIDFKAIERLQKSVAEMKAASRSDVLEAVRCLQNGGDAADCVASVRGVTA